MSSADLTDRAALQILALRLLTATRHDLSPGQARVRFGRTGAFYGQTGIELEGWSRPLWASAPLMAGGAVFPGMDDLATGLDHGTDPDHPEFWGRAGDGDPRFVEMAGIAFAIRMIPQVAWHSLGPAAKRRAAAWLLQINERRVYDCNWLFFRVLVNHALASVGAPHDAAQVTRDLDRIEEMHLGDGWYADGPGGACDHYNGFAFHFYSLLYVTWAGATDPERAARFRERAAVFAEDFIHWFDADGSCIPYGRSLTYRFAMAAFWSAAAYAGLPVFTPGILRGLVMRHLRWWMERPLLDHEGKLTLGYAYPNLNMTEIYNSPASPGWAFKSLIVLALTESDPFWQAREDPLPSLEATRLMSDKRLLVQRLDHTHATLLTSGQNWSWDGRNYAAKYARFAYSSRFAFSVPLGESPLEAACPDSTLLVSTDGIRWFGRGATDEHASGPDWVESLWSPCEGVRIRTRLIARFDGHERIHKITTDRRLHIVEGGFAIDRGPEPLATMNLNPTPGVVAEITPGRAAFTSAGYHSEIEDLPLESAHPRSAELLEPWPNTNLMHVSTVVPVLRSIMSPGTKILRCRIRAHCRDSSASCWSSSASSLKPASPPLPMRLDLLHLATGQRSPELWTPSFHDALARFGRLTIHENTGKWSEQQVLTACRDADVVLTDWCSPLLPAALAADPGRVAYICHLTGSIRGLIPLEILGSPIPVTNWGDTAAATVAESALALLLACLKNHRPHIETKRMGGWIDDDWRLTLGTIAGLRLGLYGFGEIARRFADLARILGAEISAFDPYATDMPSSVRRVSCIEELFASSEVVSIHAALTPETHGSIRAEHLALLPDGGIIINTARGALFDEPALFAALAGGRLRAGLDVLTTDETPLPPDHPIRYWPNVILTAHKAGFVHWPHAGPGKLLPAHQVAIDNIRRFISGEPLRFRLDEVRYHHST